MFSVVEKNPITTIHITIEQRYRIVTEIYEFNSIYFRLENIIHTRLKKTNDHYGLSLLYRNTYTTRYYLIILNWKWKIKRRVKLSRCQIRDCPK